MRKWIVILFLALAAVGFGATIKIGVITDTHCYNGTPNSNHVYGDLLCDGSGNGLRIMGYDDTSVPLAVTQWNTSNVDTAVHLGDIINAGTTSLAEGGVTDLEYDSFVSEVSGISGYDLYFTIGNWDALYASYGPDYVEMMFSANGIGTILPSGLDKLWWPADVTDDTPVAYIKDIEIDGQTWRLISLANVSNTSGSLNLETSGEWDNGGGAVEITQGDWFDARLDEAEAAGYPCIVLSHAQFYSTETGDCEMSPVWEGRSQAIADMEDQTIPPVVLQGHVHRADSYKVVNDVLYIDFRGDLWGETTADTDRYSHAVVTINYPAYTTQEGKTKMAVKVDGYGNQKSFDYIDPIVAHLRCEDPAGFTDANSVRDALGAYHLDPSAAVVSVEGFYDPNDCVYLNNRAFSFDGSWYAIDTEQSPVGTLPISVSFWMNSSQTSFASKSIVGFGNSGVADRWIGVAWTSSGITITMNTDGSESKELPLTQNTKGTGWHHIVVVFSAADSRTFYRDGLTIPTWTFTTAEAMTEIGTINSWAIGASADSTPALTGWVGSLDEVMVYSGALTQADVTALYTQGATAFGSGSGSSGAVYKGLY